VPVFFVVVLRLFKVKPGRAGEDQPIHEAQPVPGE
jgi:hypothetical protein